MRIKNGCIRPYRVEQQSSYDVLVEAEFVTLAAHDHLRVEHDEDAHDNGSDRSHNRHHNFAWENDDHYDPEKQYENARPNQPTHFS